MGEEGLAAMSQGQPVGGEAQLQQDIEKIAQLLLQGIPPEELVAQGIPAELVEQAIQFLMATQGDQLGMSQNAPEQPVIAQGGLAGMSA